MLVSIINYTRSIRDEIVISYIMARSKTSVPFKKRRNRLFQRTKGFQGRRKNVYKIAYNAYIKSLRYVYRDTRCRKRQYRRHWISNISNHLYMFNISYRAFMHIEKHKTHLNRLVFSQAVNERIFYMLIPSLYIPSPLSDYPIAPTQ
ncbi:50S ribosomal protein L20 [Candidatus Vidania fulgoroideorum]